jgi:hypothetical protein
LSDTKIKNVQFLEKILKKTIEWQNMLNLKNFEYKKLYNDLLDKYKNDKKFLYELFNIFNSKINIKTTINSDIDLYNYLKNSSRYFKSVSLNFRKKMLKVLNRVSTESLKEGYWTCEPKIVDYEQYIVEQKQENADINYHDFYKK